MKLEKLEFGQTVKIDGSDIYGIVTAILIRPGQKFGLSDSSFTQYEVQWFAAGVLQTAWFDGFRLRP